MTERETNERCELCPFVHFPPLGEEETEIVKIYNAVTSRFVKDNPAAFDLAVSAFRPELSMLEARKLILSMIAIHDEMKNGNTGNNSR